MWLLQQNNKEIRKPYSLFIHSLHDFFHSITLKKNQRILNTAINYFYREKACFPTL